MLQLLGVITPQVMLILLIYERFIVNYQHVKKLIPLSRERALLIYAQPQKRFLIVRIHRLVKMMPICFLKKMRNYILFCRIYNRNCHHTVFNLSSKVLTDTEINILERGLDFAPIQYKNNQPELSKDFEEFCSTMRIKWYFPNDISENFSEKLAFTPKSK